MVVAPEWEAYDRLRFYTLDHGDPSFIHQHVVDAFAAQNADAQTKPISLIFALVGLYLHVEERRTGRQIQQVHMRLARGHRGPWPSVVLPVDRGAITVSDVVAADEGPLRDLAIERWCASVWAAYIDSRPAVIDLLSRLWR